MHGPLEIAQLTGVSNKNIAAEDPTPAKRRNNLAIEDLGENLTQRVILTKVEGQLGSPGLGVRAGSKIELRP